MRVHWEGTGGPRSLGLGGMCEEWSASAIDSDESPWQGKGEAKSLFLGARIEESSASASAVGPAAAASATAVTHGADVLRQRARPEDKVPTTADNEAKPSAATTATTTAATTK